MINIFLDDVRDPLLANKYMHRRIGEQNSNYLNLDWIVVRNYNDFVELIDKYQNNINIISFDHDLADEHLLDLDWENPNLEYKEKTGYECALYFKKVYDQNKYKYPILYVHSMNPIGTEKIKNLFK